MLFNLPRFDFGPFSGLGSLYHNFMTTVRVNDAWTPFMDEDKVYAYSNLIFIPQIRQSTTFGLPNPVKYVYRCCFSINLNGKQEFTRKQSQRNPDPTPVSDEWKI